MKWEDYNPGIPNSNGMQFIETDIECPNCGARLYKRTDIILTTYPAQYRYECHKCGFWGSKFG